MKKYLINREQSVMDILTECERIELLEALRRRIHHCCSELNRSMWYNSFRDVCPLVFRANEAMRNSIRKITFSNEAELNTEELFQCLKAICKTENESLFNKIMKLFVCSDMIEVSKLRKDYTL